MNKTLFLSLMLCAANNVFARESEQPYLLKNGLIDRNDVLINGIVDVKHELKYPFYRIYIYCGNDAHAVIEPVNENNMQEAFKHIDKDNGVVCPVTSDLSKISSASRRFCANPNAYDFTKIIVLGTTDCDICEEVQKYFDQRQSK